MTDEPPFDPHDLGLQPEAKARSHAGHCLRLAGWMLPSDRSRILAAGVEVAVREFPPIGGDEIDYLLFVNGECGLDATRHNAAACDKPASRNLGVAA